MSPRRLIGALLAAAWLSSCAEDADAPLSLAWESTGRVGLCLRQYERSNGHFPDSLSELRSVVAIAADDCRAADAQLLAAIPLRHAGFDWSYYALPGRKAFLLAVSSEPGSHERCFIRLDQTFILRRSCERWWGSSMDSREVTSPGGR